MDVEKQSQSGGRLKKTILWFLTITAAIILLLFFIVPMYISSGSGTNMVIGKINKSIDGKVAMEDLSIGWFSGVRLTDLSFADNAGQVSVSVKEITTKPKYGSLLRGQVALGKTVIDTPDVVFNIKASEKTTSGPETRAAKKTVQQKQAPPLIPLGEIDLEVIRGNVVINLVTEGKKQTVHFKDIASKFDIKSPGSRSTFNLALAVVGQGDESQIKASGNVTPPKKGWTLAGTSGDFTVEIDDLDLATLKPLLALAGQQADIGGRLNADMLAKIDDGKFKELKADAVLTEFKHVTEGKSVVLTEPVRIDAKISSVGDEVKIDRLKVASSFCNIDCTGDADAVTYTAQADLKELQDFAGQFAGFGEYGFGGKLIASGKVTLGDRVKADGEYNVSGLVLNNTKTGKKTPPTNVAVSGAVLLDKKKETVGFESFRVISGPAQLQISGSVSKQTSGKSTLKASGNVDMGKLQPFLDVADVLPKDMTIGGLAKANLSVNADKGRYRIVTDGTNIQNLAIQKTDMKIPLMNIALRGAVLVDKTKETIDFESLNVTSEPLTVKLSGTVGKAASKSTLTADGTADFAKIQPFLEAFDVMPEGTKIAGTAKALVKIDTYGDDIHIVTDNAEIKNLRITKAGQAEAFEEPSVKLATDILANTKDKTIAIKKLNLESTGIKIKKGQMDRSSKAGRTKLNGRFEAQYDLAEVTKLASAFIPDQLTMNGKRNAVLNFASSYPTQQKDKMLANMDADLAFGFDSAEYMGLNIGRADFDVNMRKGVLNVKPFSATANRGKLNFGGSADFNKTPVMFNIPAPMQVIDKVHIDDVITSTMLKYLNPIFAKAVNVSGIANLHCDKLAIPLKGGNKNDALIAGTVGMSDVRMREGGLLGQILSIKGGMGQNMEILPTDFILQKGILKYDDMQLNIGDNPVNFRGQIGLDDTIDMTVKLPYTTEGRTVRIGEESTSTRLVVAIEGTASNPRINVGSLLQNQVEELIRKEGQKLLEDLFR